MDIQYMTLKGKKDKNQFLKEWENSDDCLASFLQVANIIYLMPYGNYSMKEGNTKEKFSGSFRRHRYIKRDFEIKEQICGGGYLKLNEEHTSCQSWGGSTDFGDVPNIGVVVIAVTTELLSS